MSLIRENVKHLFRKGQPLSQDSFAKLIDLIEKGDIGPMGPQGIEGPMGPQGPIGQTGQAFGIKKTFLTIKDMEASKDDPTHMDGDFFSIANESNIPENGKFYVFNKKLKEFMYYGRFTGATGPEGPVGPQGIQGAKGAQGPIGLTGPQAVHKGVTAAEWKILNDTNKVDPTIVYYEVIS